MSSNPAQFAETAGAPTTVLDRAEKPKGVISKRAQQYVFAGIAVVIVLVAMFSSNRQRKPTTKTEAVPMPMLQDTNERKVADYGAELTRQQRAADQARAVAQGAASSERPSSPVSSPQSLATKSRVSPYQEGYPAEAASASEPDPLHQRERERAYNARFASNIAFVAPFIQKNSSSADAASVPPISSGVAQSSPQAEKATESKKPVNVNVNGAIGQPYVLFEGTVIETALVNRLDGDFSGPVKVMVTNPVFSHDRQHVLIPEGTFVLGEVKRVQGFGQRRLAIVFHRLLMPDGYSVDLDQFHGLNQVGETGLKDQVNNHYAQIFGASIALGLISGAAQSSIGNVGINETGSEAYRAGVASSVSQSSTRILDRFLNINPTLTIREGHRVKVYLTNDLLLPAYENHTVPPNI